MTRWLTGCSVRRGQYGSASEGVIPIPSRLGHTGGMKVRDASQSCMVCSLPRGDSIGQGACACCASALLLRGAFISGIFYYFQTMVETDYRKQNWIGVQGGLDGGHLRCFIFLEWLSLCSVSWSAYLSHRGPVFSVLCSHAPTPEIRVLIFFCLKCFSLPFLFFCFLCLFVLVFWDTIWLCSPGWPRTCCDPALASRVLKIQ